MIPSIFLKIPCGFAAHFAPAKNFCPNSAIASITNESPMAYAVRFITPTAKLAGITVATIRRYVGEQLANTGPSEAPMRISPVIPFLLPAFESAVCDFAPNLSFAETFSHRSGNRVMIPKKSTMEPENICQKLWGISIRSVEAFNRSVKTTIEPARLRVMMIGLRIFLSVSEPPMITGNRGRTHGARMVSTPAKKEAIRSSMMKKKEKRRRQGAARCGSTIR